MKAILGKTSVEKCLTPWAIGYTKKGKPITIEIACIRKIMKIINRKTSDCYRTVELDALTPASEPRCEIMEEVEQELHRIRKRC